jgi:galactose mutarotase-like enzyme
MNAVPSGAQFDYFRGTRYQVALTEPEAHNAIHGFLRWRN